MAITGEFIKAKRLALNWTQQDLADKMTVTTRTVIAWEKFGEKEVKMPSHTEEKLHQVLNPGDSEGEIDSRPYLTLYVSKADLLKYQRIMIEVI